MENRKRNITLSIRLTAEEKEALTKKASDADLSMTDYILRCSSRKKIRVLNMSKVIVELKRIGNNLIHPGTQSKRCRDESSHRLLLSG